MNKTIILLIGLLLVGSVAAFWESDNEIIIYQSTAANSSNSSLWYNNSGVTTSDYDVRIVEDLTATGLSIFDNKAGGVSLWSADSSLFSGDITQSCIGCVASMHELDVSENATIESDLTITNGDVILGMQGYNMTSLVPYNLTVENLGEGTENVSWCNAGGMCVWDTFNDNEGSNNYVSSVTLSIDDDNLSISLPRSGLSTLTDWVTIPASGGGNPFNQWLNTTDSPRFTQIMLNGTSTPLVHIFNNESTVTSASLFKVTGTWYNPIVFAAMQFSPEVPSGNFIGFQISPELNNSGTSTMFDLKPKIGEGEANKIINFFNFEPTDHEAGYDITINRYEEDLISEFGFNYDGGETIVYNPIRLGGYVSFLNFGGGNNPYYSDEMIELNGGFVRFGSDGSITQKGIVFNDFGDMVDNGAEPSDINVKAIEVNGGGIFDFGTSTEFITGSQDVNGSINTTENIVVQENLTVLGEPQGTKMLLAFGGTNITSDYWFRVAGYQQTNSGKGYVMLRSGSITGISYHYDWNVHTSNGDTHFCATIEGVDVYCSTETHTGAQWALTDYQTQPRGVDTFEAGDQIAARFDFDTAVGTTRNHIVLVEIIYDE